MAADDFTYDVFISHNFADQRLAIELNDLIANAGFRPFLAQDELHKEPGGGVHSECDRALAESRSAIICIGLHGLGNSQQAEVETVFYLKTDRKLPVWVVLLGIEATLDHIPNDRPWLKKDLVHFFPNRPGEPGYRQILEFLERGRKPAPAAPAPVAERDDGGDADQAADELAESARRYGLTVFLGSLWPERNLDAVYNAAEVAKQLLDDAGIPVAEPSHVMSFERAAICYSLVKGRDRRIEAEGDIVTTIGQKFALREPECYAHLAALAKKYAAAIASNASDSAGMVPLIFATTNFDRLLERAFVKANQPFLRMSARPKPEDNVEIAFFETIEETNNDGRRIRTSSKYNGAGDEEVETLTEPFDREQLQLPSSLTKAFRQRQGVLGNVEDMNDQTVWFDIQIDNAIRGHARKVVSRDPGEAEALCRFCMRRGIPVIFKALGCIDSDAETGLGLDRMLEFSRNPAWIPKVIQSELATTASLFLGYSLADFRFVHLFQKGLQARFEGQTQRKRMFIMSNEGPDDLNRSVDAAIIGVLNNRKEQRFPGMTFVKDGRPMTFVGRLLKRDLVEEEQFV